MSNKENSGERDHLSDLHKGFMFVVYAFLLYGMFILGIEYGVKQHYQGKWVCETALETAVCKEVETDE